MLYLTLCGKQHVRLSVWAERRFPVNVLAYRDIVDTNNFVGENWFGDC